mgnify:CR=1 FL=1
MMKFTPGKPLFDPYQKEPMKDSCVRGTTENTAESKSQSICCTCGNCYLTDINPLSCCQQSIGCINILKEYREGTVTIDQFCERGIVYEDKPCITDLTAFFNVVLNPEVLKMNYSCLAEIGLANSISGEMTDDNFRFSAYKAASNWFIGKMGKGKRVQLPTCVVRKIRQFYPHCENGTYTGFRMGPSTN